MQPPSVYNSTKVLNSITNRDVDSSLWADVESPFTFSVFLKNTVDVYTPQQYNTAYKTYLENWYEKKGQKSDDIAASVKNEYINLLRNIALNYTTLEEKRFLSNIDFDNNEDLAIAIPFFSLKLSDICNFYIEKREKLKNRTIEVKEKGSISQYTKRIHDIVYDLIFADYGYNNRNTFSNNLSSIVQDLEIEVEELYDTYSEYFSIDAESDSLIYDTSGQLREDYFSANTNPVEFDIFKDFDSALKNEIFNVPIIIEGIDLFQVNYTPQSLDLVCDNGNSLDQFISSNKDDKNIALGVRKKLLEKYLGTDLYYLSTNSTLTDFASGEFAKAPDPASNYSNNRHPSTASIPSNRRQSARQIGVFFTPDKLGKLKFNTKIEDFSVKDLGQLEPNRIYIYPDPELFGNVAALTDDAIENYPIKFLVDENNLRKSKSFGFAANDVFSTPYDTLGFNYTSIEDKYTESYTNIFNELFIDGLISDLREDVYGNAFGVIRPISPDTISTIIEGSEDLTDEELGANNLKNYIILDGHQFRDCIEGYNFNYSLSSDELHAGYATRTGVSARTIDEIPFGNGNYSTGYDFLSTAMFDISGSPVRSVYLREFDPYIEAIIPNSLQDKIRTAVIYDGGTFLDGDDPLYADDSTYNDNYTTLVNYYDTLIEAGINGNNSLLSSPSGAASFLAEPTLSADNTFIIDCSDFRIDIEASQNSPYVNDIYQTVETTGTAINSTITVAQTAVGDNATVAQIRDSEKTAYVYNIYTNTVLPLSAALSGVFSSYDSAVKDELYHGNIEYFDVNNDVIIAETSNYFLIQGFEFDDGYFISKIQINGNTLYNKPQYDAFVKVSNPFFISNHEKIYYCVTSLLSSLSSEKSKSVYPTIYSYDIKTKKDKKIFPVSADLDQISNYFSLSAIDGINIVKISKPVLSHNNRNNIFTLTWTVEDGNYQSTVINMKFSHAVNSDNITIQSVRAYRIQENDSYTYNFFEPLSATLNTSSILDTAVSSVISTGEMQFN